MAGWVLDVETLDPDEIRAVHDYMGHITSRGHPDVGFRGGFAVTLEDGATLVTLWQDPRYRQAALARGIEVKRELQELAPTATMNGPSWSDSMTLMEVKGFRREGL